MTTEIATTEPLSFRAGDLVEWKKSVPDYQASSSYVLKYYLAKSGKQIVLTSTADGDDHKISIPAATSAAYEAGKYKVQARIEKGTEYYTLQAPSETIAEIEILPNLATATTGIDTRTHAEIVLANIEAVLENKATADNLSYTIAGRSLNKYSWNELWDMRVKYKAEVLAERRRNGLTRGNKILVQFGGGNL